jgi:hypothetical protein
METFPRETGRTNELGNFLPRNSLESDNQIDDIALGNIDTTIKLSRLLNERGYSSKAVLNSELCEISDELFFEVTKDEVENSSSLSNALIMAIKGPVIDCNSLDWRQVEEIRHDKKAVFDLRRFHLFTFDSFEGKPESYIADALNQKIYDFEKTCSKYDVETKIGIIEQIANSKSLIATAGASLASYLYNNPTAAGAALIGGAALEIANVSVQISKKNLIKKWYIEDSDIAYLMRIRGTSNT